MFVGAVGSKLKGEVPMPRLLRWVAIFDLRNHHLCTCSEGQILHI